MRSVILSQWRERKIGVIWHDLGAFMTVRAREFWICWRRDNCECDGCGTTITADNVGHRVGSAPTKHGLTLSAVSVSLQCWPVCLRLYTTVVVQTGTHHAQVRCHLHHLWHVGLALEPSEVRVVYHCWFLCSPSQPAINHNKQYINEL